MSIRVKGYLTLREVIGVQEFIVGEPGMLTLRDVLLRLSQQVGAEKGKLFYDPTTDQVEESIMVLVNGRSSSILPDQLGTPLQDGDEIAIFPPIAGGNQNQ